MTREDDGVADDGMTDEGMAQEGAGADGAEALIDMVLGRIVIRDGSDLQHIYLKEARGERGFPIVIGASEAAEIRRVVTGIAPERPLTHQLAHELVLAAGARIAGVDIVDLRNNTFFARIRLQAQDGSDLRPVDARPSDALALALRAKAPLRVAESVLEAARSDLSGPDPLPPTP
jgi:hypothetical protein